MEPLSHHGAAPSPHSAPQQPAAADPPVSEAAQARGAAAPVPPAGERRRVMLKHAQGILYRFACGMRDGLNISKWWYIMYESSSMWRTTRTILLYNGIWMGLVVFINSFVSKWSAYLVDGYWPRLVFDYILMLCWSIPMYILSIILCLSWYQEIACGACIMLDRRPRVPPGAMDKWKRLLESIGDEIYRLLVIIMFLVGCKVLQYIPGMFGMPYLGDALYFVSLCWSTSLYAFEYVWAYIGWTADEKLNFFETRWTYFAGFGAPLTVVTFNMSVFAGAALYASAIPFLIISAAGAAPRIHLERSRVRMFWLPGMCATLAFMAAMPVIQSRPQKSKLGSSQEDVDTGAGAVSGACTGSEPVMRLKGGSGSAE
uniref:Uncharacterized protein n=2 Tax=Hemiselmis andersenii TaxID=464988 RepID=A0A7S1DFA0_HEMAN|mmetsp:Transcript_10634/g.25877  ORF Transcript_10634/g.25877 Transcript_10634/m.25877 type:complete len:371 (+) Transcript_10634:150-1262(+)